MNRSTVTLAEALQRLLDATKQIDFADCKDERVWQAIGDAQGTAEGVLRDAEFGVTCGIDMPEQAAEKNAAMCRRLDALAAQPAVVAASNERAVLQAATAWWLGLRPAAWSEADHLAQPAVNSGTGRGAKLALAVAAYVAASSIAAPAEVERDAVAWQYRAKPKYITEDRGNDWVTCSKSAHDSYKADLNIHGVQWEVRQLGVLKLASTSTTVEDSEKVELNAARYKSLRKNALMGYPSCEGSENKDAYLVITGYGWTESDEIVDAAVDAAIATGEKYD